MTRLVSDVTYENQYTYNILQLLLNTLYLLSETDTDKDFILSVFEIRLMVILGFVLDLISVLYVEIKKILVILAFLIMVICVIIVDF